MRNARWLNSRPASRWLTSFFAAMLAAVLAQLGADLTYGDPQRTFGLERLCVRQGVFCHQIDDVEILFQGLIIIHPQPVTN